MAFLIYMAELPLRGGATRVFEGSQHGDTNVSFLLLEAPPGDGPSLHSHPYEEIFVIQADQATFTVGDATIEATGGQIVIAPAGIPHKFINSGEALLRGINIHPVSHMITDIITVTPQRKKYELVVQRSKPWRVVYSSPS